MASITVRAIVGEDRELRLTLPEGIPTGPVEVTITATNAPPPVQPGRQLTREEAGAILAAAGGLSTGHDAPPNAAQLTPEEAEALDRLFSGEPAMATLISEDRGERWD